MGRILWDCAPLRGGLAPHLTQCRLVRPYILRTVQIDLTQITRMWANAQRDGRPAEYRWRPLFNAAKVG